MNHRIPLLSRVADSVYWMSRYVERAANLARYIGVNLNLQLDLPVTPSQQWMPLVYASGDTGTFTEKYGEGTRENVIRFLAFDDSYPGSIVACLRMARENARAVRETIPPGMWTTLNGLYLRTRSMNPEPENLPHTLQEIIAGCHAFVGVAEATMSRGEAWQFLRLGCDLERADKTTRILDVKYFILLPSVKDVGTPFDDIHWAAVLKSVGGFEMYRQRHGRINPRSVVGFLINDTEFPRAVHYCIRSAAEALSCITGSPQGTFRHRSEELLAALDDELSGRPVEDVLRTGMHEYLDQLQTSMNSIDTQVRADFLTRSTVSRQPESAGSAAAQA